MCRLRNIAMRDYKERVTTGQTDKQTDPDKVIPMCRYASQATQKQYPLMYKEIMSSCSPTLYPYTEENGKFSPFVFKV